MGCAYSGLRRGQPIWQQRLTIWSENILEIIKILNLANAEVYISVVDSIYKRT